jgi:hypothetical protein
MLDPVRRQMEASMIRNAVDASVNCASAANCFRAGGVETVLRYYSEFHRAKAIKRPEAAALAKAGLKIAVVYQDKQNAVQYFSHSLGYRAATFAYNYAVTEIRQPPGSGIYFAVDFDALPAEVTGAVAPYFEGVQKGFKDASGGRPDYRVGVYGSGATLKAMANAQLAELFWLCGSTGYRDFQVYYRSKKWHLRQFAPEDTLCGTSIDWNETNPDLPDMGAFQLPADIGDGEPPPLGESGTFRVIARSGLRVRSGPGVTFDAIELLPLGTAVKIVGRSGDWAMIDKNGDGASDGFCLASFLQPA